MDAPAYDYNPTVITITYAGFWKRFAAAIIDGFILAIPSIVVGFIIGVAMAASGMPEEAMQLAGYAVGILLGWLYSALLESSTYQATVGKMALGIRVTDLENRRISFGQATGRHFAKILSGLILFIGYLMVAFTERKQGLHDIIAGTLVVNNE